ncbi:tigger transposable element-derived protein 6-like [Episyrphus balteatus]|uniref:tigger transposable element-derived protein 6-like n=1 Tax=Episyrphus balteatus TaxID=286459 RepID=UPI0024856CBE|nr:tigger transposable element-derived protein 6-like [Episyrphus balteatus]
MSKAKEFALKLNEDFEPTSGWLWRWKRRENIKYKKIQGELVDADTVGADLYQQEVLPNLISEYEPCNIFNADESGLCFRALPNGTLTKKGSTPKANTTSIFKPLDQGIIHCFKAYYRQIIVRKQLLAIENGLTIKQFSKSITILRALMYIKRAWWLVKPDTISNCYQKAGFLPDENSEPEVEEIWDVPIEPTIFEDYVQYEALKALTTLGGLL